MIDNNNNVVSCKKGWKKLYQPVIDEIIKYDLKQSSVDEKIGISEIKEKFGRMVIDVEHYYNLTPTLMKVINDAEEKSEEVCEYCGTNDNVGYTYATTWKKICCHNCYEEHVRPKMPLSLWKLGREY